MGALSVSLGRMWAGVFCADELAPLHQPGAIERIQLVQSFVLSNRMA